MPKRITVTQESDSGRNQQFQDNLKNKTMSRPEFVKEIEKGNYPNFHIRVINKVKTPVSNPDNSTNNNLD
ncbi:hypothetical protein C0389_04815 [bacterium]|nr:hypothetical protein [bacterium]